jgi:hypothetical protein
MPWRTEPEIDTEREKYLAERRRIHPDKIRGIYPFRDESGSIRLARADVEGFWRPRPTGGGSSVVVPYQLRAVGTCTFDKD